MNARIVIGVLLVLLAGLQYRLWFGPNSVGKVAEFRTRVDALDAANAAIRKDNAVLVAEVRELKSGYDTIEAIARSDLGMVREGETFFFQPASR